MDTEFPGVVIWPDSNCRNLGGGEYQFDVIRPNVDALKLIQLGISFFDANGNPPQGISTWQFNFRFNIKTDLNARDSINLLKDAGVQFDRLQSEGIDPVDFCELFISSGLVLNPEVVWLTYHGGYDFGYLMRILLGRNLPAQGEEFLKIMEIFFPCCYDVKVMLADYGSVRGGLQDISLQLGLKRIGMQHQAGSDALLTGMTFFRIKQRYFGNLLRHKKFNGRIHGLFLPTSDGNTESSRLHQSRSNIK
jgi:CCR4-NOT transcription complex subunit 7/8